MLMDRGFVRVRPLEGGFDAWITAGFSVEERELIEASIDPA